MRRPGKCSSSAAGSSIKSVLPSETEMIRRPRIACRNPRATVSTSGSSGIGRTNLQNSTPLQPILVAHQSYLLQFSDLFADSREQIRKQISGDRVYGETPATLRFPAWPAGARIYGRVECARGSRRMQKL